MGKHKLPRSAEWRRNTRAAHCRQTGFALFTDADVIAAYGGASLRCVAARFGITHERVRQILTANGVPVRAWGVTLKHRPLAAA